MLPDVEWTLAQQPDYLLVWLKRQAAVSKTLTRRVRKEKGNGDRLRIGIRDRDSRIQRATHLRINPSARKRRRSGNGRFTDQDVICRIRLSGRFPSLQW